jgi:hypothetical protein
MNRVWVKTPESPTIFFESHPYGGKGSFGFEIAARKMFLPPEK